MIVRFSIHFNTHWGQGLYLCGSAPETGEWEPDKAVSLQYTGDGSWALELDLKRRHLKPLRYKYFLKEGSGHVIWEWGDDRELHLDDKDVDRLLLRDFWRPPGDPENALGSFAFTGNLMKRSARQRGREITGEAGMHRFRLYAPRIGRDQVFCILGEHEALGGWNPLKPVFMNDRDYPWWTADVHIPKKEHRIAYKYAIYDRRQKRLLEWESGEDRVIEHLEPVKKSDLCIHSDIRFRYSNGPWRGSGVAVPVFSLRSRNSAGVGEFRDIRLLIDWAKCTGLRLVQILPINDTVALHRWTDSYPYAAISVFALHPIYLNMVAMGALHDTAEMETFLSEGARLNEGAEVDYEAVMNLKSKFYKRLYDQEKEKFLTDPGFQEFFEINREWLEPYAAFSCLRDRYQTPDFTLWNSHAAYQPEQIHDFVRPDGPDFDDVAVHYFIQYHLHRQLAEVAGYARESGVVLKGDLPIGIYRNSVDAWMYPHLFHMDMQAGAPPDDFSATGQNWGFPTYNWEAMSGENYRWWRKRLSKMADYFDAYRIDHILGFFRIWEIPFRHVEGLMGRFNPAIPLFPYEISGSGFYFDRELHCAPLIRDYMLEELFRAEKEFVKSEFLQQVEGDRYQLKPEFRSQRALAARLAAPADADDETQQRLERILRGMYALIGNVLFMEDDGTDGVHPKIALQHTLTYRELDDAARANLNRLYNHYFYERQESFWREKALVKLPAITSATRMLVCGEDLGMVPDCVPGVMDELGILSLEIQRMPKDSKAEFSYPQHARYLSVCTTSSHDMSTLRGWWEEDRQKVQRFYNHVLGHPGEAPAQCEPWICRQILEQHLFSPAMWAIFPLQDLLAVDGDLRRADPHAERINVPANPQHYWRYRLHLRLEDLLEADGFNSRLAELVHLSGRDRPW